MQIFNMVVILVIGMSYFLEQKLHYELGFSKENMHKPICPLSVVKWVKPTRYWND